MPKWYGGSALNPDEIVSGGEQWKIQWYRMKRWHDRVKELRKKSEKEALSAYDFDTLIAFFQNCYHLRDWILCTNPVLKPALDKLFDRNFEMGACRDICHGYKHKKLHSPSHDADFNFYREYDHFAAEADPWKNPEVYNVAFADGNDIKKYNVFDLIEKCYTLWIQFVEDNGLHYIVKNAC